MAIKKIKNLVIFICLATAMFAVAHFALAAGPDVGLSYAEGTGLSAANDPRVIAAKIIRIALGFLGLLAISLIIYAGWLWMTAGGEEEKIEKAKKILIGAVVGLVIILSAFAIASFILSKLLGATSGGGDGTVCEPACASGQYCCNSSCSNSPCGGIPPGGGDFFSIRSTIPRNLDTEVIRNVVVKVFFNKTIGQTVSQAILDNNFKVEKIAVIDAATKVETAVSPASVAGAISLTADRREINFKSNAACGDERNTPNCFEAWSKLKVTVNGASGIISVNNQSLNCASGSNCQFVFSTSDVIDTSGPKAGILPVQICRDDGTLSSIPDANLVNGWAKDDIGVADIRFCSEKLGGAENCLADSVKVGGSGQTYLSQSYKYDTSGYQIGDNYIFRVKASDLADQIDKAEFSAKIRAGHCCNGVKDSSETDIDCGGECGACDGAACANDMSAPAVCSDNLCASQFCTTQNSNQSSCEAAGYAADAASCCLCQRPPVITALSPVGGFCADDINKACLADSDCGAEIKCDVNTANGAVGNFFTIYGKYFGASPGKVFASDGAGGWIEAKLANNPLAGNAQCGNQVWSDSQIIAIVPANAKTGALKVENSNGLDTTSDKTGVPDFKINTIDRPGICLLNPNHGKQDEVINYNGIKLSAASPYFGNLQNKIAGLAGSFNDKDGTAKVPNLITGRTTSFVMKGKTISNFLNFTKEEEPYKGPFIVSFEPREGSAGQYITINGGGFGASKGASQVYFGDEGGAAADFNFPQICADSIWSDKQVIIKVSAGLANGNYKITMKIGAWPAIDTASIQPAVNFKVDSALPLKPSLCKINPIIGKVNSQVSLYGEYFGQQDNNSKVRFQLNRDQTTFDYWRLDDDPKITGLKPDKITTKVPLEVVTGPVRAIKGDPELVGNGLNFTVGVCKQSSDCGSGNLCCSAGTPYVGQCKAGDDMQKVCFPEIKACVYEWNFSTGGSGGGIGDPCDKNITTPQCDKDNTMCQSGLVCDQASCVCKKPCNINALGSDQCKPDDDKCANTTTPNCNQTSCLCECTTDRDCKNYGEVCNLATGICTSGGTTKESCAGYGPGQCLVESFLCPNSPGKCSSNAGGSVIDTGVKCGDAECNKLGRCKDADDKDLCSYNSDLNKCVKTGESCDLIQSCVSGYIKSINKTKCLGATCQICGDGFNCLVEDGDGVCAVGDDICQANSSCDDDVCKNLVECLDADGSNLCSYSASLNKCKKKSAACDLTQTINDINNQPVELKCGAVDGQTVQYYDIKQTISDINGKEVKLKCGAVDGKNVWHYDSRQTCVSGYAKSIDKAKCWGMVCATCSAGFICQQSDSGGICASDINICPAGSSCAGDKCVKTTPASCECCCNINQNNATTGANPGCCTSLTCAGICGSDVSWVDGPDTNNDGSGDSNIGFGQCTGCTVAGDQAASNAKCNCTGTSGKFCNMAGAGGLGTCLDCASLTNVEACSLEGAGSCCVDAKNKNACRGGQSFDYKEVYREDFNSDNNFAGWQPVAECEGLYSIKEGNLQFQSENGQGCNLDINYRNFNFISGKIYKIKIKIKTDDTTGYLDLHFTRGIKDYLANSKINSSGDEYEYIIDDNNYVSIDAADYNSISLIRDGNLNFVWYYKIDYIVIEKQNDYNYCAYYQCQTTSDSAACNGPVASSTLSTYRTEADCTAKCTVSPDFGQPCSKKVAQIDQCAADVCSNFSCLDENAYGVGSLYNPAGYLPSPKNNSCGTCCCDPKKTGENDQCKRFINPKLSCLANKGSCSGGSRGLCCGCSQDNECGNDNTGCGSSGDRCCQPRPSMTNVAPADKATKVCRNSLIKATFDQAMNINTFKTNVIVVADYKLEPCPAGTQYLTAVYKPSIFVRLKFWLSKMPLVNKLFAAEAKALTGNFCSVAGKVSGLIKTDADGKPTTDLEFQAQKALGANRQYYVIIKGDADVTDAVSNGVLSQDGIGMRAEGYNFENPVMFNGLTFNNAKVWSFTTMGKNEVNEGICPLDRVIVSPSSYRFQTNENDIRDDNSDDKTTFNKIADSDLVFSAQAYASNGQLLTATADYNWDWTWTSANPLVATAEKFAEPFKAIVRAQEKVVDDKTEITATANLTGTTITKPGTAMVYVILCKNIWPPPENDGNGNLIWAPWQDDNSNCTVAKDDCKQTNFALYYCRDAGTAGTADDLPAILDKAVIRGSSAQQDILKEFYFFREEAQTAAGDFKVSALTQGGGVLANWGTAAGAIGYKVYYGAASGNYTNSVDAGNTVSKEITGLTNGQKYYFALTSYNDKKVESDYSEEKSITPLDSQGPEAPVISALIAKGNKVEAVWQDQSQGDAKRFKLFYGATNNDFGSSVNISYNSRGTTTISNLAKGVSYYFGLVAYDFSNNPSATSTIKSIAAGINLTAATNDLTKQGGKVGLYWDKFAPADGQAVKEYLVNYGAEINSWSDSISTTTLPTAASPQIISGLTNGTKYYFTVKAKSGVDSAYSSIIDVTPADVWSPRTPENLSGTPGTGKAVIAWTANQTDTATYKIYYGGNSGDLSATKVAGLDKCSTDTGSCSVEIDNLNTEAKYFFAITALDGYNNESNKSDEINLIIK